MQGEEDIAALAAYPLLEREGQVLNYNIETLCLPPSEDPSDLKGCNENLKVNKDLPVCCKPEDEQVRI